MICFPVMLPSSYLDLKLSPLYYYILPLLLFFHASILQVQEVVYLKERKTPYFPVPVRLGHGDILDLQESHTHVSVITSTLASV
jgi:hypothetical protein